MSMTSDAKLFEVCNIGPNHLRNRETNGHSTMKPTSASGTATPELKGAPTSPRLKKAKPFQADAQVVDRSAGPC